MKTLYLECNMGASGDMLLGALLELAGPREQWLKKLNNMGLEGIRFEAGTTEKCGIQGTHVSVLLPGGAEEHSRDIPQGHTHSHEHSDHGHSHGHEHSHGEEGHTHSHEHSDHGHSHGHEHPVHGHSHGEEGHSHSGLHDILHRISHLKVPQEVKESAGQVYRLIAQAEAHAHGKPVDQIHFHEVGSLDAVADITGVCLLLHAIAPDRVVVSPVHVGSGQVRCAHGILPVPAPATAHILQGAPIYSGQIKGELCTPTGAALLRSFAHSFGPMPPMAVSAVGYGMGSKDFPAANCVRAFLGECAEGANGRVAQLSCNLDDMTPEAVAYAQERLLAAGALEAFTTPAQMKKGRPGLVLTCLCAEDEAECFAGLMLKHTTTWGVRKTLCERYTLHTAFTEKETGYGVVRIKTGNGYGVCKSKPEYADVARIAEEQEVPFREVWQQAMKD